MATKTDDPKVLAQNRKANHDYFIEDTVEAGIVLTGTEIKSIRQGKANLRDSFVRIQSGEAWLINCHISHFEHGNRFNVDPTRTRKLLLHRTQIDKLFGQMKEKSYALVPLKIYLKNGFAKVLLGLAKGKKNYDKRQDVAKKDAQRDIDRALRDRQKY
ncbi:SsrA-binding protein SmpB [Tumebacillus permanentifrigoris]|uniref:SsrA-binding protein n=1 Tax=Tumebacillus permanentifrigoris TaxID=378543 RepID=A0A316DV75_9BACL|nr:SsrA-binding protein SmpB [Tumebacillus permanentifrigoris]PWK13092.1 SsrA-binding protein [Tumebacillus permanentifrigoris]